MSRQALGAFAGMLVAAGMCTLPFRDNGGEARTVRTSSSAALDRAGPRDEALKHARTRVAPSSGLVHGTSASPKSLTRDAIACRFVARAPSGTTPKFDCVLDDGEIVRVKYGNEAEIHAEIAATRLLAALGYAADHEYLVQRLRCRGCPPHPFAAMRLAHAAGLDGLVNHGDEQTFEWVAVERKFEGTPIEDDEHHGWAWWELKAVNAPAADLDALRLLAVFLAHWDNKDDNQRLVCLDARYDGVSGRCASPVLMINDLGATFGPDKVNLSQWRASPVWSDRRTCTISMRAMPFGGATFPDARLTDAARVRVGRELAAFTDDELRTWFAEARFPQFYAATADDKDLAAWVDAYRARVSQIVNAGPCPQ